MRQVNHGCAARGVAGFKVANCLGGSLTRAPDEEEELSSLLLCMRMIWCFSMSSTLNQ